MKKRTPRSVMKRGFFLTLENTGLNHVVRWLKRDEINAVLYHGVMCNADCPGIVALGGMIERDVLIEHLKYYKAHYTILSFEQFLDAMRSKTRVRRGILITFDDGYRSTFTEAIPLLEKMDIPAVIFVTTSSMNNKRVLWPNLLSFAIEQRGRTYLVEKLGEFGFPTPEALSDGNLINYTGSFCAPDFLENCCSSILEDNQWSYAELGKQLMLYADRDMVISASRLGITIGSHTVSHNNLALLSEEEQRREIWEAHREISELTNVTFCEVPFSFPLGAYGRHFSDATLSISQDLGIKYLFAADGGTNRPGSASTYYRRKYIPVAANKSFEMDSILLR